MTQVNIQIASSADDGHTDGTLDTNENQCYIGFAGVSYHAFFTFLNVPIPQNAVVLSGVVRFTSYGNDSLDTVNMNVYIEASDDPVSPTTNADFNGRSLGDAVAWNSLSHWITDSEYDTPDLSDELTTHFARGGWASGQNLIVILKDNGSGSPAYRQIFARDASATKQAELRIDYILIEGEVADEFSVNDSVDAFSLTDGISDQFSISDSISATGGITHAYVSDALASDDYVSAGFEIQGLASDGLAVADQATAAAVFYSAVADGCEISDLVDAFNWTQWLRLNASLVIPRYYLTITGAADGLADIGIDISSFQARKRSGASTQLTVTVPDYAQAAAISARTNGELVIDMAYLLSGSEVFREEILRTGIDDIRLDRGPSSRTITISGTKAESFSGQTCVLSNSSYRYFYDGKIGHRFSQPDPYLNPGDTVYVEDDVFVVDWINYIVSDAYRSMEIREV